MVRLVCPGRVYTLPDLLVLLEQPALVTDNVAVVFPFFMLYCQSTIRGEREADAARGERLWSAVRLGT